MQNLLIKKNQVEMLNIKITEVKTTIKNIYDTFYENFSINLNDYEKMKNIQTFQIMMKSRKIIRY